MMQNQLIEPPVGATAEYLTECARRTGRDLPPLIVSPGRYRTRKGWVVRIDTIGDPAKSTANCKGYLHRPKKSPRGGVSLEWQIWQPNGRFAFLDEHPLDIVERLG